MVNPQFLHILETILEKKEKLEQNCCNTEKILDDFQSKMKNEIILLNEFQIKIENKLESLIGKLENLENKQNLNEAYFTQSGNLRIQIQSLQNKINELEINQGCILEKINNKLDASDFDSFSLNIQSNMNNQNDLALQLKLGLSECKEDCSKMKSSLNPLQKENCEAILDKDSKAESIKTAIGIPNFQTQNFTVLPKQNFYNSSAENQKANEIKKEIETSHSRNAIILGMKSLNIKNYLCIYDSDGVVSFWDQNKMSTMKVIEDAKMKIKCITDDGIDKMYSYAKDTSLIQWELKNDFKRNLLCKLERIIENIMIPAENPKLLFLSSKTDFSIFDMEFTTHVRRFNILNCTYFMAFKIPNQYLLSSGGNVKLYSILVRPELKYDELKSYEKVHSESNIKYFIHKEINNEDYIFTIAEDKKVSIYNLHKSKVSKEIKLDYIPNLILQTKSLLIIPTKDKFVYRLNFDFKLSKSDTNLDNYCALDDKKLIFVGTNVSKTTGNKAIKIFPISDLDKLFK